VSGEDFSAWQPPTDGRRALVWVVGVLVALVGLFSLVSFACSRMLPELGFPGDGSIGVVLTNMCVEPVTAGAGDSEADARTDLQRFPIVIEHEVARYVGIVTNVAYEPDRFFLAYRVGDDGVVVREFELSQLDSAMKIASDCVTETVLP